MLRRTFQRPIAVGFRSFVLSIDPDKGVVNRIVGAEDQALPQSLEPHVRQDLESSLSGELTKWLTNEVASIAASFEKDRWILKVRSKVGDEGRAAYLFLTRADREESAENLRKRAGQFDESTEEELQAFVEGQFRFVE